MEPIIESVFTGCLVVIMVTICACICFGVLAFCMDLIDRFLL